MNKDKLEAAFVAIVAIAGFSLTAAVSWVVVINFEPRLTALESKATAPATQPATEAPYIGEFAAERIAGRVRTHCEWKERTERTASLHCVYVKPKEAK